MRICAADKPKITIGFMRSQCVSDAALTDQWAGAPRYHVAVLCKLDGQLGHYLGGKGHLAMPSDNSEALLIAILEECSQANGHPFRLTGGVIQDLADSGLVVIGRDGWVVTTDKGRTVLGALVSAKKKRRKRKQRFLH